MVLFLSSDKSSSKSKHIDIEFLTVKERVQSDFVIIELIVTDSMIVDCSQRH